MFNNFFIVAHVLLLCSSEKEPGSNILITKIDSTDVESTITPVNLDSLAIPLFSGQETSQGEQLRGYNIEKSLPLNYVKDGSVDYTSYVQDAVNKYKEIVIPGFPILINDKGISIRSQRTISFMKGAELWLQPSSSEGYAILNIKNVSDVTINNAVIKGERYKHLGTRGEWGHGISINSSSNVTINNARVFDCWGDGIYIGGSVSSKNVVVNNAYCKSNRRNGISVTNVDGLVLNSPYTGFSDGTLPMSGIDLEPNNADNEIRNVKIINPISEKNKEYGIQISLSKFYGKDNKQVDVTIDKHKDSESASAFKISCYNNKSVNQEVVKGSITVNNPIWSKNINNPNFNGLQEPNLKLIIQNPSVYNTAGSLLNSGALNLLLNKSISKITSLELKI